jgi:glycosyltransferase involved in cell wall biosynthesis
MHVIETLEMGGAENVVADLANHCDSRFVPFICCLDRSGPIAERLRDGIPVFELRKSPGNDYTLPFRLARLMRANRIRVAVSHDWGTYLETVTARRLSGADKMIHVVHGDFWPYPPGIASGLKRWLRRRAERLFSADVAEFVAVSEGVRHAVACQTGIPEKRIRIIHNGVTIPERPPSSPEPLKRSEGIATTECVIGSVGRLATVKNYPLLLNALTRLKTSAIRFRCVLVGDGEDRASLESLSKRLGLEEQVIFLGQREDARDWLNAFDVFVLPSRYEGISRALLEAMAAGLPVVASRVGGNPEVVIEGETGFLCPDDNPDLLAAALLRLMKDERLRKQLGEKGYERVSRNFNLRETIMAHETLWSV